VNLLWDAYWPAIVAALVIGVVSGALASAPPSAARRRLPTGNRALLLGALVAALATLAWHWPLGAGARLASRIEALATAELQRQEMGLVQARLDRGPMTRTLVLSGPADDFQQRELVRIMSGIPGVSSARWANPPAAREAGR
jgi:hypothetical protein